MDIDRKPSPDQDLLAVTSEICRLAAANFRLALTKLDTQDTLCSHVIIAQIMGHLFVGHLAVYDIQPRTQVDIVRQRLLVPFVGQRQGMRQGDVIERVG